MAWVQAMRFEWLGLKAVMQLEGSITPFHGGIVASGSKPGADTYTFMQETTNQRFAPTLNDKVEDTNIDAVAAATKDEIQI